MALTVGPRNPLGSVKHIQEVIYHSQNYYLLEFLVIRSIDRSLELNRLMYPGDGKGKNRKHNIKALFQTLFKLNNRAKRQSEELLHRVNARCRHLTVCCRHSNALRLTVF